MSMLTLVFFNLVVCLTIRCCFFLGVVELGEMIGCASVYSSAPKTNLKVLMVG